MRVKNQGKVNNKHPQHISIINSQGHSYQSATIDPLSILSVGKIKGQLSSYHRYLKISID